MSLKGFDTLDALLEQILTEFSELKNVDRVIEIEGDFNDGQHLYSNDGHFVLLAKEQGKSVFEQFQSMLFENGFDLIPRVNCQLLGADYRGGFAGARCNDNSNCW